MNQRSERRRIIRRQIESVHDNPQDNRRRPSYERRNRTTVQPMPLSMMFRGDQRRFEESGTE